MKARELDDRKATLQRISEEPEARERAVRLYDTRARFPELQRQWEAEEKEQLKSIIPYLAERGWYFYMWLPGDEAGKLKRYIDGGEHEKIEQHMLGLAKEYANDIRQRIQTDWPARAKILNDAFDAHDRGLYTLSIPTMLAQADGVCREIFKAQLFTAGDRKRLKKELTEVLKYASATDLLLEFLYRDSALNEHTSARDQNRKHDPNYCPLNRHGVLHGLDLDYATESSSFRVIVILGYLQQMQMFKEVHEEVGQTIEAICKAHDCNPLIPFPKFP